jgi:hypothetical protein
MTNKTLFLDDFVCVHTELLDNGHLAILTSCTRRGRVFITEEKFGDDDWFSDHTVRPATEAETEEFWDKKKVSDSNSLLEISI